MILLAGGDSFVYGSELSDCPPDSNVPSKLTFPALLSTWYELDYDCCARPGNANDGILRMTVDRCEQLLTNHSNDDIFVIVCWTYGHRLEFPFNYNIPSRYHPFATVSPHITTNIPSVRSLAETIFKHVDIERYQHFNDVKNILTLQTYLNFKKIKYIFTTADNIVLDFPDEPQLKCYNTMIDYSKWFMFPAGFGVDKTEFPRGFQQWATEENYKLGPMLHPLDEAHSNAANLIQGKFNELVEKFMV